ncbi:hypothetical protein M8494_35885 [Serratia ureilytica]
MQADQLLNLVYDPASNRLLGVDQGIDRDNYPQSSSGARLREAQQRPRGYSRWMRTAARYWPAS